MNSLDLQLPGVQLRVEPPLPCINAQQAMTPPALQ